MKCGCVIRWVAPRGKRVIEKRSIRSWWASGDLGIIPTNPTMAELLADDNAELCQGNVVATVEAVDEPDYGGTYAVLRVSYKCDQCSNEFYPHLPSTPEDLSALLTKFVAEADAEPMMEARKAKHVAEQEQRAQMMRELEERRAEERRQKAERRAAREAAKQK